MADGDRRTIIDRANCMLKQSKTLRKLSDELLKEGTDIRASVKTMVTDYVMPEVDGVESCGAAFNTYRNQRNIYHHAHRRRAGCEL